MTESKAIINIQLYKPICITAEEYEELHQEISMRLLLDDKETTSFYILSEVLLSNEYRYNQIKQQEAYKDCKGEKE